MGESDDDIINLALTLRAMDIESIPVNFLHSIPKTPFEAKKQLTPKMLEDALPVPFCQSKQRDSRRRRREINLRSLPAEPLSREFNLRKRVPDDARSRSLRRAPHDRGPRLRARPACSYLAVTQELHPPKGGSMPVNLPLVANVPASALRLNTTTLFLVRHADIIIGGDPNPPHDGGPGARDGAGPRPWKRCNRGGLCIGRLSDPGDRRPWQGTWASRS